MGHRIEFTPSGRGKAQCAPDPKYPHGIALDGTQSAGKTCKVELPYPAPECGMWRIDCDECSMSIIVTAAGRADDPISVKMSCLEE